MNEIDTEYYKALGLCEVAHTVLISKDGAKFVGNIDGNKAEVEDSRELNFLKPSFLQVNFLLRDLIQIWLAQKMINALDHSFGPTDHGGIKGIEVILSDSQVICNSKSAELFEREALNYPIVYVYPGLIELQVHNGESFGPQIVYNLNISKELNKSISDHSRQNDKFRELLKDLTDMVSFDAFLEASEEGDNDDQTED